MNGGKITDTAQKVLEERYFIEGETEWPHLVKRVAGHFGKTLEEQVLFGGVLGELDFLPNSPALMNAGTAIDSHSACFVLPIEDSIESIFKYYKNAGLISKSGGGVGASFTKLRSSGSLVQSTDGVASGPISFMEGQDALTEVIKQGGRRRGANMGTLMCDHMDIWKFVAAKDVKGSLENFNLSVGITDHFMNNVMSSEDSYTGVPRDKKLWNELVFRAWNSAEPGVLFMDTIERGNTVPHLGKLEATNPCGEQPLLPYESCTLGSINLSNHVCVMTYSESGLVRDGVKYKVDYEKLRETVRTGVLFLNRVLDVSTMPIPECQEAMERTRKIGLGIMGLHDMLIQLGLAYDSEEGRALAGQVMKFIAEEADKKSEELGAYEGCFGGATERLSNGMEGEYAVPNVPQRRNACLTTIAPTGTLSMIADCSSGCEPYYAPVTIKSVLDTSFVMPNKWFEESVRTFCANIGADYDMAMESVAKTGIMHKSVPDEIQKLFKGAEDIHYSDHVKMQAVLQEYVDSSISKTINMPNDATVEDVKDAYELAYKLGCKGITIYRDGSRDAQVLSTGVKDEDNVVGRKDTRPREDINPTESDGLKAELASTLDAKRYRVTVDGQKVYILVAEDASGAPVEIFVKFPYQSIDSCWNTVCRQLSLSMRYGLPLAEIIKQLEKSVVVINDVASHLSRILKMYQQSKGTSLEKNSCPECGADLIFTEGCEKCNLCGWSKCG